jgi:hypothetical protein
VRHGEAANRSAEEIAGIKKERKSSDAVGLDGNRGGTTRFIKEL